jgi:hypothetical protein
MVDPEEDVLRSTRPKGRDVVGDGWSAVLDHFSLRWDKRRCGLRFNDTRIEAGGVHSCVPFTQEHFPGVGTVGTTNSWVVGPNGSGPFPYIGACTPQSLAIVDVVGWRGWCVNIDRFWFWRCLYIHPWLGLSSFWGGLDGLPSQRFQFSPDVYNSSVDRQISAIWSFRGL